ncbi:LLM class flavin-dependent oxidoreductase [Pseudonocardia benzenivorans]|jgi:alkanesulfonate monooxygenase SsuD/methylene tetrahydromethanopterin reductase-like flavin-dependent oxidoreductase (luciferase family)|uniref:LLM class flavin-dependent oxidoreductase n=1 Tax=Pseudonocardia benzenivorans TaxID=228005 RepID=A0ABW3VDX0_9PSEU|nr:LLM class flavin-dependent oxidoreductase [Pseudonocardia dioxanivorans]GJF07741.1 hypothetical protein PSD17_66860 [Pseudonocardia sp. D17]
MTGTDVRFGLTYAFRNLDPAEDHHHYLGRKLDEIVHAEELGFDEVRVAEHHLVDDGYVPCPVVAGAAIAARTSRIGIGQGVLLAPFYHPVRLAEEAAFVDNLSGGRFSLTLGLGYRDAEFRAYGLSRRERAARTAEVVQVVLACLSGEPVDHRGRFFDLDGVTIRPASHQRPRLPVWVGAHTRPAMERAARLGVDGLIGVEADLPMWQEVNAELRPGHPVRFAAPLTVNLVASDDPERDWARYRDRLAHPIRQYAQWAAADGDLGKVNEPRFGEQRTDADLARVTRFATTEEILDAYLARLDSFVHYETIMVDGLSTELPAEASHRALELFATEVAPTVRARVAARRAELLSVA